jgi:hypothetical protein
MGVKSALYRKPQGAAIAKTTAQRLHSDCTKLCVPIPPHDKLSRTDALGNFAKNVLERWCEEECRAP